MYGPTGIGVLWGRYEHLNAMQAYKLGGEMVTQVSYHSFTASPPPMKFEAGTPNFSAVIGLKAAALYLQDRRIEISAHENLLYNRLFVGLAAFKGLILYGNREQSIAIVSFRFTDIDNHSAVLQLYQQGFALRYGQHCAMPLLEKLRIDACLRVSLGCYNTIEEVDLFVLAVSKLLASESIVALNDEQSANEYTDATYMQSAAKRESLSFETMFKQARSWPEKHRQLLLLSKQLPLLSVSERSNDNRVSGCEANVWLDYDLQQNKALGYSDSKVVRGIMAILLLKHAEIHAALTQNPHIDLAANQCFDYLFYLEQLGLSTYFSEGRKDGIRALVKRLNSLK
jgi:cysteine desulfurase/selenocysteine lyase